MKSILPSLKKMKMPISGITQNFITCVVSWQQPSQYYGYFTEATMKRKHEEKPCPKNILNWQPGENVMTASVQQAGQYCGNVANLWRNK